MIFRGLKSVIREFRKSDMPDIVRFHADEEAAAWGAGEVDAPKRDDRLEKYYFTSAATHNSFAITDFAGAFIGVVEQYKAGYEQHRHFFTSIVLLKEFWGKGIGTDVRIMHANFLFNELGAHRIFGSYLASNERSGRQGERLGAVVCGKIRQARYHHGAYHDLIAWYMKPEAFYSRVGLNLENRAKFIE